MVGGGKNQMALIQNLNGKISKENGSTLIIEATVSSINGSMMVKIGFILISAVPWLLVGCISIIGAITLIRIVEWLKAG